jgi:cell division protein FtsI (penicillin-binding protein 3)
VVSVVIDEPMAGSTAGGAVAAPVFRRVSEMTLRYLGVRPKGTKSMTLNEVAAQAKGEDPAGKTYAAVARAEAPAITDLGGPVAPPAKGSVAVPEVARLPMRVAVEAVIGAGLTPAIEGSGKLTRTDPPAGTRVAKGARVVLVFEPET